MNKMDTIQTIKILRAAKKAGIRKDRGDHLIPLSFFAALSVLRGNHEKKRFIG